MKILNHVLAALSAGVMAGVAWGDRAPGWIDVSLHVKADGSADVADGLQRLIEANPNRTLWFPDGTYLLSKPIATPAHPKRSVDLRLSNYAVLKATPTWTNAEAMVRLGGIFPANDIRTVGSCYGFFGGVIDGSGHAAGLSIDGGRETKVRDVSMKNVTVGIRVKRGANSGSSDADLSDVNIVGADPASSVGVWIEGSDNTLSNMRIANVLVGARLTGGGNLLHRIHPLYTGMAANYEQSVGFDVRGNDTVLDTCYSDHFSTGFLFANDWHTVLLNCIAWWYAPNPGKRHTALRATGEFRATVRDLRVGFRGKEAKNCLMEVGKDGGRGVLRGLRANLGLMNTGDTYLKYLKEN